MGRVRDRRPPSVVPPHEDVARVNRRHRLVAWIRPATMGELVTPARRQLEHVAIRLTGQVSRQIEKLLRATRCTTSPSRRILPLIATIEDPSTTRRRFSKLPVRRPSPGRLVLDGQEHDTFRESGFWRPGPARPSSAISHRGLSWRARDYSAPRSVRLSPSAFGPHSSISHTFLGSNSNGSKGAGRLQTV